MKVLLEFQIDQYKNEKQKNIGWIKEESDWMKTKGNFITVTYLQNFVNFNDPISFAAVGAVWTLLLTKVRVLVHMYFLATHVFSGYNTEINKFQSMFHT